jgi:hypothetical protein
MKKFVLVLTLVAIIATGTAFADHSDGLGVGVLWRGNIGFGGGIGHGIALSLHVPKIPIFWGIDFHLNGNDIGLGVTGDKYIYDETLIEIVHWYLGLGGYVDLYLADDAIIDFGARLPIGLSWHFLKILELFVDVAPSIGIGLYTHGSGDIDFPHTPFPVEIGIRIWF